MMSVFCPAGDGKLAPQIGAVPFVGILVAASERRLMAGQPSSGLSRIIVGQTPLVIFGAAAAVMFIF